MDIIHWWGPEKHLVCYPVSQGRLINVVAVVPAQGWSIESWSTPGKIEEACAAFADWNEQVTTLISAAETTLQWALYDRDPFASWSNQCITLIGDAAHPMLPFSAQGATQAIEDAWVLAGCLKNTTDTTIPTTLRRYEALRKPRTTKLQQQARLNGMLYHLPDGEEQRQRDIQLATHNVQSLAWLYNYDAEHALSS